MKQSLHRITSRNVLKYPKHNIYSNVNSLRSISTLSHISLSQKQYKYNKNNNILNSKKSFYTFVQQYQKAVTLTFGKLTSIKDSGLRIYIPLLQTMYKVDMRTRVHELLPQHIITRDNVSCSVSAVMYYHVQDAEKAVLRVTDVDQGIRQLAQTELRDLLCQKAFNAILENRDEYSKLITSKVERRCGDWGVLVEHVQIKNIDLTDDMMVRAMAKEAEASRERKAAIIRADGEYRASIKLAQAATILDTDTVAVELRRLQTLERIAKEKNQTTLVVPMQIFNNTTTVDATIDHDIDLDQLEKALQDQDKLEYDQGDTDSLGEGIDMDDQDRYSSSSTSTPTDDNASASNSADDK